MREIEECRAEVFRRSEKRIRERRKRRNTILTCCAVFCVCFLVYQSVEKPTKSENDKPMVENEVKQESLKRLEICDSNGQIREYVGDTSEVLKLVEGMFLSTGEFSQDVFASSKLEDRETIYSFRFYSSTGEKTVYELVGCELYNRTSGKSVTLTEEQRDLLLKEMEVPR